jgi:thiazole synthase
MLKGGFMGNDFLCIADKKFKSRLIIGSGKFPSDEMLLDCIKESEAEIITVAVRRVDLKNPENSDILKVLDPSKIFIIPNTSGARNSKEAIRTAFLAREMGLSSWIKLEVVPDPRYLLPDPVETLKAAEILVKEGFTVLPYINADPVLAKKLEDIGCATVMPLGAPIGTNKGLTTIEQIKIIVEQSNVPVIVDAGIGKPSDACRAMELGVDACMINTAISTSDNPAKMARAFKDAIQAGRMAYLAGLAPVREFARASSPLEGILR